MCLSFVNYFLGYDYVRSSGSSSICDATKSSEDLYCDILDQYLRKGFDSLECLCTRSQNVRGFGLLAPPSPARVGAITSNQNEDVMSSPERCSSVPYGNCGVLYGEKNCEGWSINIPQGSNDLHEDYRNDAEVIVVKKGCKFIGKEEPV